MIDKRGAMKRRKNLTIEDVYREIAQIQADPKYKDTWPDSPHIYTKYARKKLHDLSLLLPNVRETIEAKKGGREMSEKRGAVKRHRPCTRCVWREDHNGNWETRCGETFCFDDGGVRPNKFYFCPNCGKPIDEVKYEGEES